MGRSVDSDPQPINRHFLNLYLMVKETVILVGGEGGNKNIFFTQSPPPY